MAREWSELDEIKFRIMQEKSLMETQATVACEANHDVNLAGHLHFAAGAYSHCIEIIDKIIKESRR